MLASWIAAGRQRVDATLLAFLALHVLIATASGLLVALFEPQKSVDGFLFSAVVFSVLMMLGVLTTRRLVPNQPQREQAERQLSAREQRLRSMASALPDRVVILDADGWYHDVMTSEYDTSPSVGLGGEKDQRLHDILPAAFADFCLQKVRDVIANNEVLVLEYDLDFTDPPCHIEGRLVPFADPLTQEPRVIWVSRDITERTAMENRLVESEKLLRTVFTALPDRTMIFDAAGNYVEILQTAYHTSHNPDETSQIRVGHSIRDHFPPEFAAFCFEKIRKTIESGTMQVFDYPSPLHEVPKYFEARTIPFIDPVSGSSRVLWITRDISAQHEAEGHRLALALQQEKLEFFQQFVDNMTHDLKNPLTLIETGLYFIQRAEDASSRQSRINGIHQQVAILNQMIDDMLIIGRLDTLPDLNLEDVDCVDLLQETIQKLQPQAEKKNQRLRMIPAAEPVILSASRNELSRALMNLIENAIKYTPDHGQVDVDLRVEPAEIVIAVRDTGIGIDANDLPQIFDRFYRSESGRRAASGTGLGLAIVKRIIELHGGRVDVESAAGRGSSFSVRLPVQSVPVRTG